MNTTPSGPSQGSTNNINDSPNPIPTDPTPTPTPTSNTEGNIDSSGTGQENEETLILGRKRKFISTIWEHFDYVVKDGVPKAICKYCSKELGGKSKNGTTHLKDHNRICPMKRTRSIIDDFSQKKLKVETAGDKKGQVLFVHGFNAEEARRDLVNMVILHEYHLSIVEHYGFRKYSKTLQPSFNMISRNTLKSDILKVYEFEKSRTMKVLGSIQSKVAITTDMWTAQNQKRGFMAITGHWIDSAWTLQSRILSFVYVPHPHNAEVLSEELLKCFAEWNISRRLSSITVDNCTSNDAIVDILEERLDLRALPLNGKFFHMRCCAHILNLIVKDGLEIIEKSIENVRDSVAYWKATPKRSEIFREVCDSLSVEYKRKLVLDCKTRWNSTFLMLQVALMYKDVFPKLAKRDKKYKCLPSDDDWDKAKDICSRFEIFYDVTLLFSGTKYPTANIYFPKIFEIKLALMEWVLESDVTIRTMAHKMLEKFDKYWDIIHGIMGVACVLDPRYKLMMLECCYNAIFAFNVDEKVQDVKEICYSLFHEYENKVKNSRVSSSNHATCSDSNATTSSIISDSSVGKRVNIFEIFDTRVKKDAPGPQKCELDLYLEEAIIPRADTFDILDHWKAAQVRFPILSMIVRDIYAIPISTVASESAFSASGRFLSPHRNRLHQNTLEALMCTKDWLLSAINQEEEERNSYVHSSYMDDGSCVIDDIEDD